MLDTGADYITQARRILNDGVVPYRYLDLDLYNGLTLALYDMDRLRPDILLNFTIPSLVASSTSLSAVDPRYRRAVLDYVCGYAEMQDVEAADANRSMVYQASFAAKLLGAQG